MFRFKLDTRPMLENLAAKFYDLACEIKGLVIQRIEVERKDRTIWMVACDNKEAVFILGELYGHITTLNCINRFDSLKITELHKNKNNREVSLRETAVTLFVALSNATGMETIDDDLAIDMIEKTLFSIL